VKRIGLAGGIGSGKSAASAFLVSLGFDVIDADDVAHDIVKNGQPALRALVDAFGSAVLDRDGNLDRAFVGQLVFSDQASLRRLNSITHPAIGLEVLSRLEKSKAAAVFVALPLFRTEHRASFGLERAWAIEVSPETAIGRLVDFRGFTEQEARARLGSQISNADRRLIVDRVIPNEGSLDELHAALRKACQEDGLLD